MKRQIRPIIKSVVLDGVEITPVTKMELCSFLTVSPRTVERWVRRGMPVIKLREGYGWDDRKKQDVRFNLPEVLEWLGWTNEPTLEARKYVCIPPAPQHRCSHCRFKEQHQLPDRLQHFSKIINPPKEIT